MGLGGTRLDRSRACEWVQDFRGRREKATYQGVLCKSRVVIKYP